MTLYLEEEGILELELPCEALANQVVEATLDYIGCPYEVEVNLLLTMSEQIREMNQKFRDMDMPTDVLSFPMVSYEAPGRFDSLEEDISCFHPESGELMLGDIVINKERVLSQAKEYGHSGEREYAFLIAHSMLHLMGYDHMEEEDRMLMETKQKEIMTKINILR